MSERQATPAVPGWVSGARFIGYVMRRFAADHCTQRAAGLTYTSLIALVPLLAVGFAIFSAFPAFEALRGEAQSFIFENFVPEIGGVVAEHLDQFTQKTGGLTAVGVIFLIASAVMLLSTIGATFDTIWRIKTPRSLVIRLLSYWAVVTLTPLLFGASLSLSSYLFAAAKASGVETYTGPLINLAGFLPLVLQFAGFTIVYMVIPNAPVRWRDALAGGLAAGLLFEVLKKGFGLYVSSVPTYQTIYGAMATVPIFLIWMYVSWTVVLFGAEMAAALPEWRSGHRSLGRGLEGTGPRLAAALSVLHPLAVASLDGGGLRQRDLQRRTGMAHDAMGDTIEELREARYVAKGERGEFMISRDLEAASLGDLRRDLGLDLVVLETTGPAWTGRFADIAAEIEAAGAPILEVSLKDLLAAGEGGAVVSFPGDLQPDEPIASGKAKVLAWLGLTWLGSS
jgi:membrane protein